MSQVGGENVAELANNFIKNYLNEPYFKISIDRLNNLVNKE